MLKCKSNIVWQLGPFKIYGEHFYLIEEIHTVIAAVDHFRQIILVKRCQNCKYEEDIHVDTEEFQKLVVNFPMAFAKPTLEAFKNARATSL